jgi:hypothetical protein
MTSAGPTTGAPTDAMNDVAGDACPHTTDGFAFYVAGYGTNGFGCGAATGKLTRSAVVTNVDSASMELSTCPPGERCAETLTLYVSSPDFAIPLVLGAYVHLEATVSETSEADDPGAPSCEQSLEIVNLPSYGGATNPADSRPILWFAGADGTLATTPDGPVQVREAQGCGSASRAGFADQQISFDLPATSPADVILPMGSLHVSSAPDGTQWSLRNLRSFRTDGAPADDQRQFAYWIAYVAPAQQ